MNNDDRAVASAELVSCEVARQGAVFMLVREGAARVGQSSLRIVTSGAVPAMAGLVHLKDIAAVFLSYREAKEDAGVSMRTNDVLIDVRNPKRVFKLKMRTFADRCNFVDALADQAPWADLSHLDAAGVDAIFGIGDYDQDSDAETILSQSDNETSDEEARQQNVDAEGSELDRPADAAGERASSNGSRANHASEGDGDGQKEDCQAAAADDAPAAAAKEEENGDDAGTNDAGLGRGDTDSASVESQDTRGQLEDPTITEVSEKENLVNSPAAAPSKPSAPAHKLPPQKSARPTIGPILNQVSPELHCYDRATTSSPLPAPSAETSILESSRGPLASVTS